MNVELLFGVFPKRDLQYPVQITLDQVGVGRVGVHARETVDLFGDLRIGVFAHILLFRFELFAILLDLLFTLCIGTQLLLDLLELLL
ncbi:hypothetical protein D1872_318570 [compost metagenome]